MTPDQLKSTVRAALAAFNDPARREDYLALYAPDASFHGFPPDMPPTTAGVRGFYQMLWAAMPDMKLEVVDMVAEGDRVAVTYAFSATHQGAFMGVPATGRPIQGAGMTALRFHGDKVVERWQALDMLGVFMQMGMTLAPAAAPATV